MNPQATDYQIFADTSMVVDSAFDPIRQTKDHFFSFEGSFADSAYSKTIKVPDHTFFATHELTPDHFNLPVSFHPGYSDWLLPILLSGFIFLALLRVSFRKKLEQLFMGFYSLQHMRLMLREGNPFKGLFVIGLGYIFLTMAPVFLLLIGSHILKVTPPVDPWILLFGQVLTIFIFYLCLRLFLIWILKVLFLTHEATSQYLANSMIINFFWGIFLLPFLIISLYANVSFLVYLVLGVAVILFIYKLLRGILIGISYTKFSIVFLFLYLCTVEFLPLIIVIKLVIKLNEMFLY